MRSQAIRARAALASLVLAAGASARAQEGLGAWPGPYALTSSSFSVGVSAPLSTGASPGGLVAAEFAIEGDRPFRGLGAGLGISYRWHLSGTDGVEPLPGADVSVSYLTASLGPVSLRPQAGIGAVLVSEAGGLLPNLELKAGLGASLRLSGRRYLSVEAGVGWMPGLEDGLAISVTAGPRFERAWAGRVSRPRVEVSGLPELYSPDGDGVDDDFRLAIKAAPAAWTARWSLSIVDPSGASFVSRGGAGPCPKSFAWEGVSDSGAEVVPATDYGIRVEVEDVLGRRAAYESRFTVDILVERVGDKYRVRIPPILFPSDSAALGATGAAWMIEANARVLSRLVELFGRFPEYRIAVEGHANSVRWADPAAFAREQAAELVPLSLARAEAVRAALVGMGVDPKRISAAGLGAAEPLSAFGDPSGAWRNRRVEIILSKPARP